MRSTSLQLPAGRRALADDRVDERSRARACSLLHRPGDLAAGESAPRADGPPCGPRETLSRCAAHGSCSRTLRAALALGVVGLDLPIIAGRVSLAAVLIARGRLLALLAVWQWERTRLVVTTEKLFVRARHARTVARRPCRTDAVEARRDRAVARRPAARLRHASRRAARGPTRRPPPVTRDLVERLAPGDANEHLFASDPAG